MSSNNSIIVALVIFVAGFAVAWYAQADRYDARIALREKEIALAAREAEDAARRREQELQKHADQVSKDAVRRQQALADRTATTERVARLLRDDIARLAAGPTPSDPAAARYADDARLARGLLGACAEEYRAVAGAADQLRDQVTGLQDWARAVAPRGN